MSVDCNLLWLFFISEQCFRLFCFPWTVHLLSVFFEFRYPKMWFSVWLLQWHRSGYCIWDSWVVSEGFLLPSLTYSHIGYKRRNNNICYMFTRSRFYIWNFWPDGDCWAADVSEDFNPSPSEFTEVLWSKFWKFHRNLCCLFLLDDSSLRSRN